MRRYSFVQLLRNAVGLGDGWQQAWRSPEPKSSYDVVIVGGGGHGLATAYYLAKNHGVRNIAVLEKGWLGGGNTGRNTTVVRSNYLWDESAAIYEHSLKLWEGLTRDLNYNLMFSQRGLVMLAHTEHELNEASRRVHANRLNGIDAEIWSREQTLAFIPILNGSKDIRYPVIGSSIQKRAGIARHDAVAWGFARAADALGVDIIQNCEVTAIRRDGSRVVGLDTTRGAIDARKVGLVAAGHSSVLAGLAGFRLPIESHPLQAMVSEPIKPVLDTVVMSGTVHAYVSQSDKGELVMGAGIDAFNSYAQRGSLPILEEIASAMIELFPIVSRLKVLRSWGGIVDICPDASPIIGKTPVDGLYINCGWGTGGFKATPGSGWVLADTIANDRPHPLAAPFSLNRFSSGRLIDEHGAAAVAH